MTLKDLEKLERNALALRNIASLVLEQVAEEKAKISGAACKTRKPSRRKVTEQDIIERLLTKRRKPKK